MTRAIFLQANVFYTLTPRVKNVIRFLSRRSDRRRAHSRRALSRRALSRRAQSPCSIAADSHVYQRCISWLTLRVLASSSVVGRVLA